MSGKRAKKLREIAMRVRDHNAVEKGVKDDFYQDCYRAAKRLFKRGVHLV